MCLYWYHSSVPEAQSAGRIRCWPTTNLLPLVLLSLCSFSLCFCCGHLFFYCCVALCLASPSSPLFFNSLSPSEVTAPLLVTTLSTHRSDICCPWRFQQHIPAYMHKNSAVPLALPWYASPPLLPTVPCLSILDFISLFCCITVK